MHFTTIFNDVINLIRRYNNSIYSKYSKKAIGAGVYDFRTKIADFSFYTLLLVLIIASLVSYLIPSLLDWTTIKTLSKQWGIHLGLLRKSNYYYYILLINIFAVLIVLLSYHLLLNGIISLYLSIKKSSKAEKINKELYSLIIMLHGSLKSKASFLECLRDIMYSDLSKELREEMGRIYYGVKLEGKSLRSALLEVAETTPSQPLSIFLKEISAVIESTRDLMYYLSNKLQMMQLNESLNLDKYVSKVNFYVQAYVLILSILGVLMSLSGAFQIMGKLNLDYKELSLEAMYIIALSSVPFILLFWKDAPEKHVNKLFFKEALYCTAPIFSINISAIILYYLYNIDIIYYALLVSSILSLILYIVFSKYIRFENRYDQDLFAFLTKIAGLLDVNTFSKAVTSININEFTYLKKDLKELRALLYSGKPIYKILKTFKDKAFTFSSYLIWGVLYKAVLYTTDIKPIIDHLISEYHAYYRFITNRKKVLSTANSFLLIGAILVFTIFYMLIGVFHTLLTTNTGSITTSFIEDYTYFTKTCIVSITLFAPAIFAMGEYDPRKYFLAFLILSSASLVIMTLIEYNIFWTL